jgi:hypothetical protein
VCATELTTRLHHRLISGLLQEGFCPTNLELSETFGIGLSEIEAGLTALSAMHGVVLHPHAIRPWVVHPFSLTPTINWIEASRRSWWAPCVWCAMGVATLVRGLVKVHTRIGAEGEPLTIKVVDGEPQESGDIIVHFAIPPARAWDNVHAHCSMVLPFRSSAEIDAWAHRHGLPKGEAVPLNQVAALARAWYGSHADPDWHKWSVDEAQAIFNAVGLGSEFWNLQSKGGRF